MSTQRLPPGGYPPAPPPAAPNPTRQLGPLKQFTTRRYMLMHLIFTLRLIGRCLADPRVRPGSKALFLGVIGFLLTALLVPELTADLLTLFIPIFDLVGIPFEGVVDWGFLVVAMGSLISLFPPDVLRQHISELKGLPLPPGPPPDPPHPPQITPPRKPSITPKTQRARRFRSAKGREGGAKNGKGYTRLCRLIIRDMSPPVQDD
jgi:hypothetical protein